MVLVPELLYKVGQEDIYIYKRNGKDNFILPFLEKKPHSHLGKYCRRRVINCVRASIIDALSVAVVLLQGSFGG